MRKYKVHYIAPNAKPRPEGSPFKSEHDCQRWCDILNNSNRGLGVSGHYKALPVEDSQNA